MPTASWNGAVIADSDNTEVVDGNHYFPASSIRKEFFEESAKETVCSWKGTANYYHVVVDGKRNDDAAWYYPEPKSAAANIASHVAFWKGVEVHG